MNHVFCFTTKEKDTILDGLRTAQAEAYIREELSKTRGHTESAAHFNRRGFEYGEIIERLSASLEGILMVTTVIKCAVCRLRQQIISHTIDERARIARQAHWTIKVPIFAGSPDIYTCPDCARKEAQEKK